jgi:hypothetical protein
MSARRPTYRRKCSARLWSKPRWRFPSPMPRPISCMPTPPSSGSPAMSGTRCWAATSRCCPTRSRPDLVYESMWAQLLSPAGLERHAGEPAQRRQPLSRRPHHHAGGRCRRQDQPLPGHAPGCDRSAPSGTPGAEPEGDDRIGGRCGPGGDRVCSTSASMWCSTTRNTRSSSAIWGGAGIRPLLTNLRSRWVAELDLRASVAADPASRGRGVLSPAGTQAPLVRLRALSWFDELDASADAFYEPTPSPLPAAHRAGHHPPQGAAGSGAHQQSGALLAEQERIQSLREALAGAVYQLEGPFNT